MVVELYFSAINPKKKRTAMDTEEEFDNDNIDLFGDNPEWEPGWVRAYRINALGQVINILVFLVFMLAFWSIALSHTLQE